MELPFIDEHRVVVAAPAAAVWPALVRRIENGLALPAILTRALGAEPSRATGTPFGRGSTVPGFEVDDVVPERLVRLTGRHHFSRYELLFSLHQRDNGTVLKARSSAEFPGVKGFLYRKLVIDSGAHRVLTKRLLESVGRSAR